MRPRHRDVDPLGPALALGATNTQPRAVDLSGGAHQGHLILMAQLDLTMQLRKHKGYKQVLFKQLSSLS